MSRIGSKLIEIPSGVEVKVSGSNIGVKGPKGELSIDLPDKGITVEVEDASLTVKRSSDARTQKSLHGLSRTLIDNMVIGVTEGFSKTLEIIGVGYRAKAQGTDKLELALGFSHPVVYKAPQGITFEVPEPTKIKVMGIDKQTVGQVAAEIRAFRKPEPYKGKGVRYEGEHVRRKAGKAGKA